MKYKSLFLCSGLAVFSAQAEIVQFALSPAGTSAAVGLSPANEIPAVAVASEGSGDEILGGIVFDTDSRTLAFGIGYGSSALFTDLTGAATGAHIHGPAAANVAAGVIHNFIANGQHLAAGDPANGGVILGSVVLTEAQAADLLNGLYYVNIHTASNPGGEIRGQLIAELNHAPIIACPNAVEVECASHDGTTVHLTANVSDADGDALTVVWKIDGVVYQTDNVAAGDEATAAVVHLTAQFGYGNHAVEVSVSDGTAEPVKCQSIVVVVDTLPPAVSSVVPSRRILWPPNHKMIPVSVRVNASDVCGTVISRIVRVTSNEPVNGNGDGNTAPDWLITGNLTVDLRAERQGGGKGRVYTITIETTDHAGLKTTSVTEVRVPHDSRGESRRY